MKTKTLFKALKLVAFGMVPYAVETLSSFIDNKIKPEDIKLEDK